MSVERGAGRGAVRGGIFGRRLILAALLPLAACSSVPDELNPAEWYRGVSGWFRSDDAPADDMRTASAPDAGIVASRPVDASRPYPELSAVPEPPRPTLDPGQRIALAETLQEDRRTARQDDAMLRQAVPAPPSGAGLAPPPARTALAPAPVPAPRVEHVPVESLPPAAGGGVATLPGVRYAIPPRPPVAPPQPLSPQQGRLHSSVQAMPVQIADVEAFFGEVAGWGAAAVYSSDSVLSARAPVAPPQPLSGRGLQPQLSAPVGAAPIPGSTAAVWAIDRPPSVSAQVASITFPNGVSALTPSQRARLRTVAEMYRRYGGTLWVVGHASHRTPDMPFTRHMLVNYGISVDRANAVVDALRGFGVPEEAIVMSARSDWDPVYYEMMPAGEAQNRRVEIYLYY